MPGHGARSCCPNNRCHIPDESGGAGQHPGCGYHCVWVFKSAAQGADDDLTLIRADAGGPSRQHLN